MIKPDREKLMSPPSLFILYIFFSSLVIFVFRLIFPAEDPPLAHFSLIWRFIGGAGDLTVFFPALAMSALVIPFGSRYNPREKFTSFSPRFLQNLSSSIFCAIGAAAVYGLLFILVQPVILNYKTDLEARGRLYRISAERAWIHAGRGEWPETGRFLEICDRIWPGSPEIAGLRVETSIRLDEIAHTQDISGRNLLPSRQNLTTPGPVSASQALIMAETAMREERYFDAHWLATLAGDLAAPGSVESANAARLASRAWNAVASLEPNSRQSEAYRIYHLKLDAYRALVSNDWIPAYYLFRELLSLVPNDPDGLYYVNLSEQGLIRMAFFIDEIELQESPAGAFFSLPYPEGRLVMRFSSLSLFPDIAYGIGLEILCFNPLGKILWRMEAPYAKILPLSETGDNPRISILMHALDRLDGSHSWSVETSSFGAAAPSNTQLSLNLGWDEFILLSGISRGYQNLGPAQLMAISGLGSGYGYLPQIYETEIISRFAEPLLFLPILVLVLALGWRLRAVNRPRYIWLPMLGIFPLVFNGMFQFIRNLLGNIALWAVISAGFTASIFAFSAGILVMLFLSLIVLSAQHG